MYLVAMVLSIVGIAIGWLPGVGWLGLAMAAVGCVWGALGLSNRKVVSVEIGYSIAGSFTGGLGLPWILAFQLKHLGGEPGSSLLDYPLSQLIIASCGAFFLFLVFILLGRLKLRPVFFLAALVAMAAATYAGTSAWTAADKALEEGESVETAEIKR